MHLLLLLFVLVPATPTISSSVTYGPFGAGAPPYSLYGYSYAFSNYYASFTIQRTGDLLTTYLNDAINVYVSFTGSFGMQAYIDSSGGSEPGISIYGWETYDVNQSSGSSYAQAFGNFIGDVSFVIPAGDTSQLSYTASPLTVGVYPDAPYSLVSSVNASSGFNKRKCCWVFIMEEHQEMLFQDKQPLKLLRLFQEH